MIDHDAVPSAAEFLARILPPAEYQDCVVVAVQGFFVWCQQRLKTDTVLTPAAI
jgi:hypothetical protein